jgi:hypothetical protein
MRSPPPPPLEPPLSSLSPGAYSIDINGDWSLTDLYIFPRTFEQTYYLFYSLLPGNDESDLERVKHTYSAFPWQGGYSAVNFYNQLRYVVPSEHRPELISIHYSSPGLLELGVVLGVAITIGRIIKSVALSINEINTTYTNIMKGMQDRKILRLEERRRSLNLSKEEREYVEQSLEAMARILGFENIKEINERTGDPYKSLKILLSLYRRVRTLADYEREGKAVFPTSRRDRPR